MFRLRWVRPWLIKSGAKLVVEATAVVGRSTKTWQNAVSTDLHLPGVFRQDIQDRVQLRAMDGLGEPSRVWHTTLKSDVVYHPLNPWHITRNVSFL